MIFCVIKRQKNKKNDILYKKNTISRKKTKQYFNLCYAKKLQYKIKNNKAVRKPTTYLYWYTSTPVHKSTNVQ